MTMTKKILLIIRAAPYGGIRAREALDVALLFSAFAPQIAVLFSGEGVWQLVDGQRPATLGAKSVEATLGAFAAYDITHVYADAQALALRGLATEPLLAGAQALNADALCKLLAAHDRVVTL